MKEQHSDPSHNTLSYAVQIVKEFLDLNCIESV